ncbi:hypothetical protein FA13DRAFT_1800123 [Coprinellus micaceus]|uniref:DUF6699 domain-containing protein n=1 Tax=Coprinellus micaceus TaxID=71717 RepID=A0A4Y7SHC7_COPMI|nr:hypothetical protein FA13DRAFT_1800123 [Coprinellus micaceus]
MSYHYAPSQASWGEKDGKPYYASPASTTGSISTWGTSAHTPPLCTPDGYWFSVRLYISRLAHPTVYSHYSQTSSTYVGTTAGSGYCASLASGGSFAAELHPALRPGAAQALQFDIASSRFPPPGLTFDPNTPAFSPGLNRVNLEFQGLSPRWVSKLSGSAFSSSSSGASVSTASSSIPPITVATILEAIFQHCRSPVTRDQDSEMPPRNRAMAAQYAQQRVAKCASRGQPASNAMMLMDVLGPNTMFFGIMPKADDPKTWIVCFGRSPRFPPN